MQLVKLSITTALLLSTLQADNYINVQVLQYNEHNGRASISTPSVELNYDLGADYTFNGKYTLDSISGASPIFYDSTSGASAYSRGETTQDSARYGGVEYDETKRMQGTVRGTKRFENRDEVTLGASFSNEYDYRSTELSAEVLHWVDEGKNQAFSMGVAFQRNVILVDCKENSICDATSGASKKLRADAFFAEAGFSQNLNSSSVLKTSLFFNNEDGYLTNPFMNVLRYYNTTPTITNETRPHNRRGYGGVLEYTKAIGESTAWHSSYRYYHDDWEIDSHTLNNDLYYELNSDTTLGAGLRYYSQSAAHFFSKEFDHFTDEVYASSDERLGDFNAINLSMSIDYKITKQLMYNLSGNYYKQNEGTIARYFTTGVKYKF